MASIPFSRLKFVFLRKCQGPPIPGKLAPDASLVAPQNPPFPTNMKTSIRPPGFMGIIPIRTPSATTFGELSQWAVKFEIAQLPWARFL
jgi:hypothetical protein